MMIEPGRIPGIINGSKIYLKICILLAPNEDPSSSKSSPKDCKIAKIINP